MADLQAEMARFEAELAQSSAQVKSQGHQGKQQMTFQDFACTVTKLTGIDLSLRKLGSTAHDPKFCEFLMSFQILLECLSYAATSALQLLRLWTSYSLILVICAQSA